MEMSHILFYDAAHAEDEADEDEQPLSLANLQEGLHPDIVG